MFLTLPFMAAIQIISACIGWETRRGLARNIAQRAATSGALPAGRVAGGRQYHQYRRRSRRHGRGVAAGRRRIGGHSSPLLFGIACLIAEVFIPYHRYAGYLKLLTLVLLFYVAAAFSVHIPWGEVARATLIPTFSSIATCC